MYPIFARHNSWDGREFLESVSATCCGKGGRHRSKWRTLGVRNMIGLYVGQDIPDKIAFIHYKRLLHLVLRQTDQTNKAKEKKIKTIGRWSFKESKKLIKSVLMSQGRSEVKSFEDIKPGDVDWEMIARTRFSGARSGKNIKDHFKRTITAAILEELEPRQRLLYRKKLLKEIKKQKIESRREIDWDTLEKSFWPKTRSLLVIL